MPLLLVGPALLPGRSFLPQHPVTLVPLSVEYPAEARNALGRINYWTSDALFPFLTDAAHLRSSLEQNTLPTWNPDQGLGYSSVGGSLISPWYPPNLLHGWIEPARAMGWNALLHWLLFGAGCALFVSRRGVAWPDALLAGCVVQCAGLTVFGAHYGMKLAVMTWFPWCLLSAQAHLSGDRGAGLRLCVFVGLSFLAGFVPLAVFGLAAVFLLSLLSALGTGTLRRWPTLVALGLLGVGAAGISLLPMAQSLAEAHRPLDAGASLNADTPALSALGTLLAPGMLGLPSDPFFAPHHPLALWLSSPDSLPAALQANGLEWNLHAGLAAFILACAGLLARPKSALLPSTLILVSLGFGLGLEPFSWLRNLPGLSMGAPTRAFMLSPVPFAWLAALGLGALRQRCRRAGIGLALGCLLAIGLGFVLRGQAADMAGHQAYDQLALRFDTTLEQVRLQLGNADLALASERLDREAFWLFVMGVAAALAGLITWRSGCVNAKSIALGVLPWFGLVGAEGLRLGQASLTPQELSTPLFPSSNAMEAVREAAGDGRILRLDESPSGVAEVEQLARPNLPEAYGIRDLTPYVIFTPKAWVQAVTALDPAAAYRSGISRLSDPALLDAPLLDLLGVTCILAKRPIQHEQLEPTFALDGFHVHRRSLQTPAGSRILSPSQLNAIEGDTLQWHLSESAPPDDWQSGDLRSARPSPSRMDFSIKHSSGGWLLMDGAASPGWKALVNGKDVPIHTVNDLLRAIRVPPGDSVVRTKYEPWALRFGFLSTLLCLFVAWRSSKRG